MIGKIIQSIKTEMYERKLKKIQKQGEQYKKKKKLMDTYAEYWPDKREKKTSTIMLIVIVVSIVAYVVAAFALQWHTGLEVSPTMTTAWFSFWGVEIIALTGIRISKIFNTKDDEKEEK